jgi:hypothetical protein
MSGRSIEPRGALTAVHFAQGNRRSTSLFLGRAAFAGDAGPHERGQICVADQATRTCDFKFSRNLDLNRISPRQSLGIA